MPERENRTGIMFVDVYGDADRPPKRVVNFEGGKAEVVGDGAYGSGGEYLQLDTHEGPRSRIFLYGEWRDFGRGFEFVEMLPGASGSGF